jgi:hypothetical protein
MQNRPNVILTVFVLLIGGGLIVYLGLLAKSVWVGLLILVGVVSLLYALGTARVNKGSGYGWGVYIGVLALAGAVYMSRLAGRFWWTPVIIWFDFWSAGSTCRGCAR